MKPEGDIDLHREVEQLRKKLAVKDRKLDFCRNYIRHLELTVELLVTKEEQPRANGDFDPVCNFCCVSGWSSDFRKREGYAGLNPRNVFALRHDAEYASRLPQFVFLEPVKFILRTAEYVQQHAEEVLGQGKFAPFFFVLNSPHSAAAAPAPLRDSNPTLSYYCFCMGFTDLLWAQDCFVELERVYVLVTMWNLPEFFFGLLRRVVRSYRQAKLDRLGDLHAFQPEHQLPLVSKALRLELRGVELASLCSLENYLPHCELSTSIGAMLAQLIREDPLILPDEGLKTLGAVTALLQALRPLPYPHPLCLRTPKSLQHLREIPTPALVVLGRQSSLTVDQNGMAVERAIGRVGSLQEWVLEARRVVAELVAAARGQSAARPQLQELAQQLKESQLFQLFLEGGQ